MDLMLGNPLGLWALLGVPAVLLIHLLQRETQIRRVSTLFLIESLPMTGASGRVVERVRHSLPLWLQLLAVGLLTWLLVRPLWLREDSFQRVVLVLDSSVSMSAFQDRLKTQVETALSPFRKSAAFTEWTVLESDASAPTLYSGPEWERLLDALDAWRPRLGGHDPAPALRVAQGLSGERGAVLFVTDHISLPLPEGIQRIAVGEAIPNCGFAGLAVEEADGAPQWQALVRNHGAASARRAWWVAYEGGASERRELDLAAGESRILKGGFPPGVSAITLHLDADRFSIDDRLPVVRPRPKLITSDIAVDATIRPLVERMMSTVRATELAAAGSKPDVEFLSYRAPGVPGLRANAVCFPRPMEADAVEAKGWVAAEDHPLLRGLTWHGLLVDRVAPVQVRERDEILLWRGDQPLLLLRSGDAGRQLIFTFDLLASNAPQLPALVLVVHRFLEEIRAAKPAPQAANVEARQRLAVAAVPEGPEVSLRIDATEDGETVSPDRAVLLRAPERPCHFTVRQGRSVLFHGAARFGDLREADFTQAASGLDTQARAREQLRRNSRPDPLTPVWLLLLGGLLLGSWYPSKAEPS